DTTRTTRTTAPRRCTPNRSLATSCSPPDTRPRRTVHALPVRGLRTCTRYSVPYFVRTVPFGCTPRTRTTAERQRGTTLARTLAFADHFTGYTVVVTRSAP